MPDIRLWSACLNARRKCSATAPTTSRRCKSIRSASMRVPDCSSLPGLGNFRPHRSCHMPDLSRSGTAPPGSLVACRSASIASGHGMKARGFGSNVGVSSRQNVAGMAGHHESCGQESHSPGQGLSAAACVSRAPRTRLIISRGRVAVCGGVRIPYLVPVYLGGILYSTKSDRTWKCVPCIIPGARPHIPKKAHETVARLCASKRRSAPSALTGCQKALEAPAGNLESRAVRRTTEGEKLRMQLQGRAVAHINRNRETLLTFGAACRGKNLISGALLRPR